jgi:amino-acid N-acetyltransferase
MPMTVMPLATSRAAKAAARAAAAHDAAPRVALARKAHVGDVEAIAALVNGFAAEDIMLPRTPAQVLAALDDYVVVRDVRGRLLACGALREYSPSLAELVSLAVARAAHGRGLGSVIVAAVERLARKRGFTGVFAHTLSPAFFEGNGYAVVERARFPEKQARATTSCVWKDLVPAERAVAIAA